MKEALLEGFRYLGVISAISVFVWQIVKPHAENFIQSTVQTKFEVVESKLKSITSTQQDQQRTQTRIEEIVTSIREQQQRMLDERKPGGNRNGGSTR